MAGSFGLQGEQLGDDRAESVAGEAAFVAGGIAAVETPDTAFAGGQQRAVLGAEAQVGGVVGGGGAGDACGGGDRVAWVDIAVGFFGLVDQVPQGVEVLREPFGFEGGEAGERCAAVTADGSGEGKSFGGVGVVRGFPFGDAPGPSVGPGGEQCGCEAAVEGVAGSALQGTREPGQRRRARAGQ